MMLYCRCAINYEDNNPKNGKLVVMGVGQDMEELTALCTPEMLLYALIRVVSANTVKPLLSGRLGIRGCP